MGEPRDHFFGHHYHAAHSTGPLKRLNPTKKYHLPQKRTSPPPGHAGTRPPAKVEPPAPRVAYLWTSRNNRKGRHAIAISHHVKDRDGKKTPTPTNTWQQSLRGIGKMFVRYPLWDVSYDVAVVFTLGSVVWVINGFFSWLPIEAPSSEFSGESDWGGGLTACIGATIFEIGSVLLMLEAVNENRSDCFGWAVEESLDGFLNLHPTHGCRHSHAHKGAFLKGTSLQSQVHEANSEDSRKNDRRWSWWPTWHELRTHYFREIGFLACLSQMIGATIFWISGITALPPILNNISTPATNGVYWLPQVIGGSGFIVSSALFMLEVQPRWYIPAPKILGWHIGFWNFIGAIGFTLCGALGFGASDPGVEYALTLSTFIGSWAFLIGSGIQWFESLDKYPVRVEQTVHELSQPERSP